MSQLPVFLDSSHLNISPIARDQSFFVAACEDLISLPFTDRLNTQTLNVRSEEDILMIEKNNINKSQDNIFNSEKSPQNINKSDPVITEKHKDNKENSKENKENFKENSQENKENTQENKENSKENKENSQENEKKESKTPQKPKKLLKDHEELKHIKIKKQPLNPNRFEFTPVPSKGILTRSQVKHKGQK